MNAFRRALSLNVHSDRVRPKRAQIEHVEGYRTVSELMTFQWKWMNEICFRSRPIGRILPRGEQTAIKIYIVSRVTLMSAIHSRRLQCSPDAMTSRLLFVIGCCNCHRPVCVFWRPPIDKNSSRRPSQLKWRQQSSSETNQRLIECQVSPMKTAGRLIDAFIRSANNWQNKLINQRRPEWNAV